MRRRLDMTDLEHQREYIAGETVGALIIGITERERVEEIVPAHGIVRRIAEGQSRLIAVKS
jgi:hypothetical protein